MPEPGYVRTHVHVPHTRTHTRMHAHTAKQKLARFELAVLSSPEENEDVSLKLFNY